MSNVLDTIIIKYLAGTRDNDGTVNYETINVTGNTISADISGAERGYMVDILYDAGVGPNIKFFLEVSSDNTNFVPDVSSEVTITDASGNIIFDIVDTNTKFVRLAYEVTAGSLDIQATLSAKRRH